MLIHEESSVALIKIEAVIKITKLVLCSKQVYLHQTHFLTFFQFFEADQDFQIHINC